jgi:hypothetical protein
LTSSTSHVAKSETFKTTFSEMETTSSWKNIFPEKKN